MDELFFDVPLKKRLCTSEDHIQRKWETGEGSEVASAETEVVAATAAAAVVIVVVIVAAVAIAAVAAVADVAAVPMAARRSGCHAPKSVVS